MPVAIDHFEGGLADVLPFVPDAGDLASASGGLASAMRGVFETIDKLRQFENLVIGLTDGPLVAALRAAINEVKGRIRDLRQTGVYMLPVGFGAGPPGTVRVAGKALSTPTLTLRSVVGLGGLQAALRIALLNERDPFRPAFSPDAYTSGTLIAGFGIGPDTLETIRNLVESTFLTRPVVLAAADLQKFVINADPQRVFSDAYAAYRLANSATPPSGSPWVSTTLESVLPSQFGDMLLEVEARLSALLALSLTLNGLKAFFALVEAALQNILDFIRVLENVIAFLNLLLTRFPLLQWRWTSMGGAAEIAASLLDWFDPAQHPELRAVPSNSFMLGVMLLVGGSSEAVDAAQAIISPAIRFGV